MPGLTTGGLPYPFPSEPVGDGADAIRLLAEAIDKVRHSLVRHQQLVGENVFHDKTTFTPFPNATDATALSGTFVKGAANTRLTVRIFASGVLTSGLSQGLYLGININGTTTPVARQHFNEALERRTFAGMVQIVGLPAGSYPFSIRFRSDTAAQVIFQVNDDFVDYEIQETV